MAGINLALAQAIKRTIFSIIIVSGVALVMAAAWPVFAGTPVLDAREANQRARIAEGVN